MRPQTLESVEQALGYKFKNHELIVEALTHRSHHHEFKDSPHNERLEFLGDAVLDLCVTEMVMHLSPTNDEGHLSKLRSQLVSAESLASAARRLGLGFFVRLGRGEDLSGGRERDSLLADLFEAVLAAIYYDGGLEEAKNFLRRILDSGFLDINDWASTAERLITRDYKSRLQEICQSAGIGAPTYFCLDANGPDHQRRFTMALLIQNLEVSRADASTKKEATQLAAQSFLDRQSSSGLTMEDFLESLGLLKVKNKNRAPNGLSENDL